MDYERYHSLFSGDSPYGRAVALLAGATTAPRTGVVLDIGCGFGAIAEPVGDLGFTYIGLDADATGLADLAARGFETAAVDLARDDTLAEQLRAILGGRPLAGVCALDVIEHLTNGEGVLAAVRAVAVEHGAAPLVVSIPNVTHLDLAAKLLLGRWDVTPVGLLDVTHVSLYSPARLAATFAAGGWAEVGADDFPLAESDQHEPADAATMAETPLRTLLARLRERAGTGALTNQFVRAYRPTPLAPAAPSGTPPAAAPPSLSLLLFDDAAGVPHDLLLCLDAQRSSDFELLVCAAPERHGVFEDALAHLSAGLCERTRLIAAPPGRAAGLAAGVAAARGHHLSVLDNRSLVFPHYVETFCRLAVQRPGAVLRTLALAQALAPGPDGPVLVGGAVPASRPRFLLAEHLFETASPPGSYALPRSGFVDLGFAVGDAVPGAEEETLLLEMAMLCGVHEAPGEVTLLRRRVIDEPAESTTEAARQVLAARLDAGPLLFPAGSVAALWDAREALHLARQAAAPRDTPPPPSAEAAAGGELERLRTALAACERELAELRASTSWRVTAPLRRLGERRPR